MKTNFKKSLMICVTSIFLITSCSNENESTNVNSKNDSSMELRQNKINFYTPKNLQSIENLTTDFENLENVISEIQVPAIEYIKKKGVDVSNTADLITFYENCEECDNEYRNALVPLLKNLSQANDSEVVNILTNYSNNIYRLNLDETTSNNLKFIVSSMIIGANNSLLINNGYQNLPITIGDNQYVTFGFWDCIKNTGGKAIGRGIATGMITGCVGGGIAGATAGTLVVPVLGTATGGVAGCIYGGAAGAVTGAVTGAIWAAADCI